MPRAIVEAGLADVVVAAGRARRGHRRGDRLMSAATTSAATRARCAATTTWPSASACAASAASTCCSTSAARWSGASARSSPRAARGDLVAYAATLRGDKDELDEVPRPRDDQRLPAVAQPRAVGDAGGADPPRPRRDGAHAIASAPGAPAAPTAPRPTPWPRSPPRRPARRGLDPRAPTSTPRMVQRARAGVFSRRGRARRADRDAGRSLRARRRRAGTPPTSSRAGPLRAGRPAAHATPGPATYDLVLCRNTVIYFNEDVRDALHGRLAASLRVRRPPGRRRHRARLRRPRALGLMPESPFIYRKL